MDKRQQIIEVIDYQSDWPQQFEIEASELQRIFADNAVTIHHIGSTAVPGLYAKPVIDILLEVHDILQVDEQNAAMAVFSYEAWGEYGIAGRRFFLKGEEKRTHHVHAFQVGDPAIPRHLIFRDYLCRHPLEAKMYGELKRYLAEKYPHDRRGYVSGKQDFVRALQERAMAWAKASSYRF